MIANLSLVMLVTVAAWALPALSRPTLPFGVRVPGARAADPAITTQRRRFARCVPALGALAAVAVALGAPDAAVLVLGAADMSAYFAAHHAVAAAKRRGGWYAGTRQAVTTDTSFRTDPERVPWPLLLPSVLLVTVTTVIGLRQHGAHALREPVLTQVALTLLVPLLITTLLRARPDLDAARPADSAHRYRLYLRTLARLLLMGVACANLTLLLLALRRWEILAPSAALTAATWLPPIAAGIALLVFAVRVGEAGHRLPTGDHTADSGYVQRDDDRHWHLAGMIYANRNDPAILLHQRVGGRWTLNFGNPVVWLGLATAALVAGLVMTLGPR